MTTYDKPLPLLSKEVQDLFSRMKTTSKKISVKIDFEVGELVEIQTGPFRGQRGTIEHLYPDRGLIQVSVNIFGRRNPVEAKYTEVERL